VLLYCFVTVVQLSLVTNKDYLLTYLLTYLLHERLNGLALLFVYPDITLDYEGNWEGKGLPPPEILNTPLHKIVSKYAVYLKEVKIKCAILHWSVGGVLFCLSP